MSDRDVSPVRPVKRTEFYNCRKTGPGWTVMKTSSVAGSWTHFDVEHDTAMKPVGIKTPLSVLREDLTSRLKSTPFYTVVFEYDLVAPSEIILVVWVGMTRPKKLPRGNTVGLYMPDCRWPSDMSAEQYRKTQEY